MFFCPVQYGNVGGQDSRRSQGIGTEVNVSDLKFMDDLFFFEFRDLDTLRRFIECVTTVFTQHSFQVNVGKLEVCAVVAGPGTQARVAQLKRRQLRIHPRDAQGRHHELVLKESAKYLGSILHVGANNKEELRNRVTQANTLTRCAVY